MNLVIAIQNHARYFCTEKCIIPLLPVVDRYNDSYTTQSNIIVDNALNETKSLEDTLCSPL